MIDLGILPLILAAAAGTVAARAAPLFSPGVDRLPPIALAYLRMIGPAALGGIAAKEIFLRDGVPAIGPEAIAVIAGALAGRLRGSLAIAMVVSVIVVLALRATISA
mgnify:FL=1